MKNKGLIIIVLLLCFSCKKDTKTTTPEIEKTPLSIAEKIANAHGYEHWKNVSELKFTFNVDRDSSHFERSFIWQPKTKKVIAINKKDSVTYNRNKVDSLSLRSDQAFINDKFWLLPAFQMVWDSGTTISEAKTEIAPISKDSLSKITLTYSNDGGYTPGDAYDFYYDKNYHLKEWIFRKGNSEKPSMITAFSEYKTIEDISFPTKSTKDGKSWSLYFTDIEIKNE